MLFTLALQSIGSSKYSAIFDKPSVSNQKQTFYLFKYFQKEDSLLHWKILSQYFSRIIK